MTFLAATYYTDTPGQAPVPSPFSNTLFHGLYTFANTTTSRVPLSDWTNTDEATAVGFQARPVYGAMYAPMLVVAAGPTADRIAANPLLQHAHDAFAAVHAAAGL